MINVRSEPGGRRQHQRRGHELAGAVMAEEPMDVLHFPGLAVAGGAPAAS